MSCCWQHNVISLVRKSNIFIYYLFNTTHNLSQLKYYYFKMNIVKFVLICISEKMLLLIKLLKLLHSMNKLNIPTGYKKELK